MTQSQQLRKLAARSATAFLLAALCVFPLYIDKFSNLGVVKFTGICTLSWAFALWLGALACVGARPDPGRLPWKADPALWALGAVTASGVVSTVLSLSPGASFWGLGGYYGGCMMVLFTAAGYLAVRAFAPQKILNGLTFCVGVTTALVTVLYCSTSLISTSSARMPTRQLSSARSFSRRWDRKTSAPGSWRLRCRLCSMRSSSRAGRGTRHFTVFRHFSAGWRWLWWMPRG